MTVAANVKQTLAGLRGALATLETLATLEKTAGNKEILDRNVERISAIVTALEERTGTLESVEPQYKGL